MTRESRILLVVGLLAVLGVSSLVLIADRYRRLIPAAPRSTQTTARDVPDDLRRAAVAQAVDRFVAVRTVVCGVVRSNREALSAAVDPRTGKLRGDASEAARESWRIAGAEIARRKDAELGRTGMRATDYDRLRIAYLAWLGGNDEPDEALGEAFEDKRARLVPLELGALEALDSLGAS